MAGSRSSYLDEVAIVGVAESELGILPHRTELDLHMQAATRAVADAGLLPEDVDGIMSVTTSRHVRMPAVQVAEALGIVPKITDSVPIGGAAVLSMINHAAMAIAAGACNAVLVTYGSTQASGRRQSLGGYPADPGWPSGQFEVPFGFPYPLGAYAMAATRHMALYGTRPEDLAEIAVSARQWAMRNPVAFKRDPLTVEDVLASPIVASPLHVRDCCLVTDGGGAVVVARRSASRTNRRDVRILGAAESHTHAVIASMPELTTTIAVETGKRAFEQAGLRPEDVDVAQIYDSFTITVAMTLEDLGFCAKGEAGAFVRGNRLGPGGALPTNTQGGGLSFGHPGMFGVFLVVEAVRQLRGEADARQVESPEVALCHGTGGILSSGATLVLGKW